MRITTEELRALLGLLPVTLETELNCEEFMVRTPAYLEALREAAAPPTEGHEVFLHHLKICPECQEEFEGLCDALRDGIL